MTTRHFLMTAWSWNPWVLATCVVTLMIYCARYHSRPGPKIGWLLVGLGVFFGTLASPIDTLADGYLFSAHMVQHLLLLLVVPPLLLFSLPLIPQLEPSPDQGGPRRKGQSCHPAVTWLLGVGGMWLWHAPRLCNAAVTHGWIHRLQYGSLLLMGVAFWWPILSPWIHQRLAPWGGVIYLFSACLGCTILGIIITFAPVEVCSIYLHPVDRLNLLPLIQDQWGLTPAKDQQLGGLIMWVPACLIYFCGIFGLMIRWYADSGRNAVISPSSSPASLLGGSDGR